MLRFDVDIVSEIMLQNQFKNKVIEFGLNKRSETVVIRAVQDITAQVQDLKLKDNVYLELVRDKQNANVYRLTI